MCIYVYMIFFAYMNENKDTDLQGWIEHNDITGWLNPRFTVHLYRYIRMRMDFYMSTLNKKQLLYWQIFTHMFPLPELFAWLAAAPTVFGPNAQRPKHRPPPACRPNDLASKIDLPYRDPMDSHQSPSWKCAGICKNEKSIPSDRLKTYLNMFNIMMPSTGGRSTTLPSTSSRSSRCSSLTVLRPTILRSPIFT